MANNPTNQNPYLKPWTIVADDELKRLRELRDIWVSIIKNSYQTVDEISIPGSSKMISLVRLRELCK